MPEGQGSGELVSAAPSRVEGQAVIPAGALEPKDPAALVWNDPVQQERWSVTLDGISKEEAQVLARRLLTADIPCHLEVIAARVSAFSHTFIGMSGLMQVCVRRQDLLRATDFAQEQFPETWTGERLAHGRLWTPSQVGDAVSVVCLLPWADCWDLAAQLLRHAIPAIVLIYHMKDPSPQETMTYAEAIGSDARSAADRWSRLGIGDTDQDKPIEEEHQYSVAVEDSRLTEATEFARAYLGDRFVPIGTPYDG